MQVGALRGEKLDSSPVGPSAPNHLISGDWWRAIGVTSEFPEFLLRT